MSEARALGTTVDRVYTPTVTRVKTVRVIPPTIQPLSDIIWTAKLFMKIFFLALRSNAELKAILLKMSGLSLLLTQLFRLRCC